MRLCFHERASALDYEYEYAAEANHDDYQQQTVLRHRPCHGLDIKVHQGGASWILDVGVVCPGSQRFVDLGSQATPGRAAEASRQSRWRSTSTSPTQNTRGSQCTCVFSNQKFVT